MVMGKLMLPMQQIWNLRHGFSGCFFEATRFSQSVKKSHRLETFATLEHQVTRKIPLSVTEWNCMVTVIYLSAIIFS